MPTPPKLLIQMSGAPGSGKSTVARLLRPSLNGVVIDHDILRSSLLSSSTTIPVSFSQAAKQAYLLQWALADDLVQQNLSVIVDSPCNYPEALARGSALAARYGVAYWYVECRVRDVGLLDRRLRRRESMVSQRTAVDCPPAAAAAAAAAGQGTREGEDSQALFEKWIKSPCRPLENVVVVDGAGEPEVLRDQILKQIVG